MPSNKPLVAVLMGSKSDWETMQHTSQTLAEFEIAHECRVLSAHRTPDETAEFVRSAEGHGVQVLIAAAGGAAHLAGAVAAQTVLPVLGVPMKGWSLDGLAILELVAPEDELEPDNQYSMFQPSEAELGETTRAILAEVERTRPRRVETLTRSLVDRPSPICTVTLGSMTTPVNSLKW